MSLVGESWSSGDGSFLKLLSSILFSSIRNLNAELITSGADYDDVNPNLITKLIPEHYLKQGNDFENFTKVFRSIMI